MQPEDLHAFPDLMIGKLNQWAVTQVSGDDRLDYLQGQLSCDMRNLDVGQQTLAAHCDAKGKVWSVLRLLAFENSYWLFQKASAATVQQPELIKYSVFAKVTIETVDATPVAVIGQHAHSFVRDHFGDPIALHGGIIPGGFCVHYPNQPQRYLLLLTPDAATRLDRQVNLHDDLDSAWEGLDIVAGLPNLEAATSHQFIPQALNLHCLDAISFDKGCYSGQEVVARAKFRGSNKRATLRFSGQTAKQAVAGSDIEMKMGENWRRCGTLLSQYQLEGGHCELLAVVPIDSDPNLCYRLKDDEESRLTLAHLPYSLDDEVESRKKR